MRKPLQRPPSTIEIYPVASLDDMAGMKVAAIHGRIEAALAFPDEVFTEYGLDHDEIRRIRRFLLSWYESLSMRLAEATLLAGEPES